jgi:hypothetical protein
MTAKEVFQRSNYACAVQRTRTDSKLFDIALAVSIGLALCGLVLEWWL